MTIKQAQLLFEQHLQRLCSKDRYRLYCKALDRLASYLGLDREVNQLLWNDVQKYKEIRRGEGAKSRIIQLECATGRAMWDWLMYYGRSDTNPFRSRRQLRSSNSGSPWLALVLGPKKSNDTDRPDTGARSRN